MRSDLEDLGANLSSNPAFQTILTTRLARRDVLRGGLRAAALAVLGGAARPRAVIAATPLFTFKGVPVSTADTVTVPEGYTAEVLYAWGDPISEGPAFKADASNIAAEQELQAGMHHDGIHYFPLPPGSDSSTRGLLAVNHEYTDDGLLHPGGMEPWTAEKVAKSQAAHGVAVVEVTLSGNRWAVVRPSALARRITARTPIGFDGPAAGHALLKTAADPDGRAALGTINNCAHGATPWGTYLTCEENFNAYFSNAVEDVPGASPEDKARILRAQKRYGITKTGFGYRWHEHDRRFDAAQHPNEPNRFGWIVEIDPYDATQRP